MVSSSGMEMTVGTLGGMSAGLMNFLGVQSGQDILALAGLIARVRQIVDI